MVMGNLIFILSFEVFSNTGRTFSSPLRPRIHLTAYVVEWEAKKRLLGDENETSTLMRVRYKLIEVWEVGRVLTQYAQTKFLDEFHHHSRLLLLEPFRYPCV